MASILPNGGTCEKMREVFFLHPVTEKNLSRFFKIHFRLPGILPGKKLVKLAKMAVLSFWGRAVLER
jgi:hypothetical protein